MKKKVLIIGAGFLQSFVIQQAKKLGYTVLAVDADPNAIGFRYADAYAAINIVDEKACLDYAKKENIDGVLTAATDYGVLTASYIAREMGLRGIGYDSAKTIKNKYLTRKCLFEHRVDDAEQGFEISRDTDLEALKSKVRYPVMVKPCDGSGSRGAGRVDSADKLPDACRAAMEASITHRAVVETFISGHEYGAESLVVDGEIHVLAIMRKWMTAPPYYAELGHAIPTDLPPAVEEKARGCVERALRALGVNNGSVNMDMIITADGRVYIVDVGARMGGNMIGPCIIPYGTGIDYMANMLRNAVGDPVDFSPKEHGAVATKLLAFDGGIIEELPDFEVLEAKYNVEIYHHMKEGQTVNQYRTNLDGLGYIVAKASTIEVAIDHAQKAWEDISACIRR